MPDVTLGALRAAARAVRLGVDGAQEQLEALFLGDPYAAGALLGLDSDDAVRTACDPDVAVRLAAVDLAGSRTRRRRRADARERAEQMAVRLAATRRDELEGRARFDLELLRATVREAGYDVLVFDSARGALGIERGFLHALLRECRTVDTIVELVETELVIEYSAARSRGRIRLRLAPPVPRADVLRVPLDITAEPEAARTTEKEPLALRLPPERPYAGVAA